MSDWNGMNWIRQATRLAIYLRDGLSCVYCGASVEQGDVILTLDHLIPRSKGGSNRVTNLATCCRRCNSARGDRPLAEWCRVVAEYIDHGVTADEVKRHVSNCRRRKLDRRTANRLIEARGSAAKVMASIIRED